MYPHTSNWDFILGVLARSAMQLRMHWVGKHTLFRWPFESVMRALGGIPVDRARTQGFVERLRKEFDRYEQLFLVITPEGTRSRSAHWKSGFYHIALRLKVPLGLACINYGKKEVGIMEWLDLSGNVEQDLSRIREVYRDCRGKHHERTGEIRFRD